MSNPPGIGYKVTSVAPYTEFGPTGQQIPGKQVTIETTTGYTGTVFVPSSVLGDMAAVTGLIEGEVRRVAAVQAITGTVQAG